MFILFLKEEPCGSLFVSASRQHGGLMGCKAAYIYTWVPMFHGPGSVVGIATAYGLDGPGIESRWGARFSAPVQTGPEAHPASCTADTGSFLGVRCCRSVTLTPHPLLVQRSKIE